MRFILMPLRPPTTTSTICAEDGMLTVEQKTVIKKCFDSYRGWGEDAPMWFTCQIMAESSGFKELPFCDVYGYIYNLHQEHIKEWQCMVVKRAEERKKQEELKKLKKAEEKKNGQNKRSRKVHDGLSGDIVDDAAERNM